MFSFRRPSRYLESLRHWHGWPVPRANTWPLIWSVCPWFTRDICDPVGPTMTYVLLAMFTGCTVHGHAQLSVVMDRTFLPTCLVFGHRRSETVLEILSRVEVGCSRELYDLVRFYQIVRGHMRSLSWDYQLFEVIWFKIRQIAWWASACWEMISRSLSLSLCFCSSNHAE